MTAATNEAPAWFTAALAHPHRDNTVDVNGTAITYRTWGNPQQRGILLVHGGGAHLHWWDFIAPLLADDYYVVALDLGGMGDSGRRNEYTAESYIAEIIAVAGAAGLDNQSVLAGHSMGGAIALRVAVAHPDRFSHLLMLDSPLRPKTDAQEESGKARSPFQNKRFYPDFETAVGRFRLMPEQPVTNSWIFDFIAKNSLTETDEGWCWKFDDNAFKTRMFGQGSELADQLTVPLAIIYGQLSKFFDNETLDYMHEVLPDSTPFIPVPEAHHHLFLDQPLAFVTAIRALMRTWAER
ncbi:MAG: alpha/beta hydrolase [Gammaproteobacteria bacterium]|nr:MAG: alpha/beta hydrolase [Gammaproteobacteria bacterium]RLA10733.1 MAG: alpha/beta hydrolase [Gammaproteobacteria bacterium]RLA14818.1 MAG: alpha/beta hydrolase [Gammaproteobacteria bacterium]